MFYVWNTFINKVFFRWKLQCSILNTKVRNIRNYQPLNHEINSWSLKIHSERVFPMSKRNKMISTSTSAINLCKFVFLHFYLIAALFFSLFSHNPFTIIMPRGFRALTDVLITLKRRRKREQIPPLSKLAVSGGIKTSSHEFNNKTPRRHWSFAKSNPPVKLSRHRILFLSKACTCKTCVSLNL